jgi:hypothetical protein
MDMSDETTQRDLGRLEGKIEGLEGKIDMLLASLPAQYQRIEAVEQWKSRMNGAISAVVGAVAVLAWFIGTLIDIKK